MGALRSALYTAAIHINQSSKFFIAYIENTKKYYFCGLIPEALVLSSLLVPSNDGLEVPSFPSKMETNQNQHIKCTFIRQGN